MLTDQDVEKRQALVRKLQSWGDGAIMGVKKIAADTQKEILDGCWLVSKTYKLLPKEILYPPKQSKQSSQARAKLRKPLARPSPRTEARPLSGYVLKSVLV